MKMAVIIHSEYQNNDIITLMNQAGIDFYTRWEKVTGKGHNTLSHLGHRGGPGFNTITMIVSPDDDKLEVLIEIINYKNDQYYLSKDRIRIFIIPVEKMI